MTQFHMDANIDRERLRDLLRELAVRSGEFTLASGARSTVYVDCRQATLTADGHALAGRVLIERIREAESRGLGPFVAVGGLELGAVPLACAISVLSTVRRPELDAFVVRKQAKDHGTALPVEGMARRKPGDRVVLVEDVITSGGSVLRALDATRAVGLEPQLVLSLVDRGAGGAEAIRERKVEFQAVFELDELVGNGKQ